jgi:hypothetical protein
VSSVAPPSEVPVPVKRAPKILRNLEGVDETAPIDVKSNVGEGVKVNEEGDRVIKGRNMGPKAREKVSAHRAVSDKIVEAHPATEAALYCEPCSEGRQRAYILGLTYARPEPGIARARSPRNKQCG